MESTPYTRERYTHCDERRLLKGLYGYKYESAVSLLLCARTRTYNSIIVIIVIIIIRLYSVVLMTLVVKWIQKIFLGAFYFLYVVHITIQKEGHHGTAKKRQDGCRVWDPVLEGSLLILQRPDKMITAIETFSLSRYPDATGVYFFLS